MMKGEKERLEVEMSELHTQLSMIQMEFDSGVGGMAVKRMLESAKTSITDASMLMKVFM